MSDFTTVYFTWIKRGFNIPSTLVEFSLFGNEISIKFYGVIIAFGFILAALFGGRMAYKWRISLDKMLDVLIYGTLAGIIGARAYYVIFQWDYYKLHPAEIPQIWQGGLAIYGGIIGGLIAAFIVCKVRKINILNLLDMGGISLLIGQGIGRWGNFMNQEAFGTNTDAPWGMWSKKIAATIIQDSQLLAEKGITMDPNKPVHPTFLYESLWCLIGFLILYVIYKKFRKFSGQLFPRLRRVVRAGQNDNRGLQNRQPLYRTHDYKSFAGSLGRAYARLPCAVYSVHSQIYEASQAH